MNYQEFACALEKEVNLRLTGGVQASLYTAVKNNGTRRTGILIETPGINISPTIYLDEYFAASQAGRTIREIAEELLEFYRSIRREESWDQEKILSYEGVKDRVVFKLVNTAKNRNFLRKVPHLDFLDLSIVFYVLIEATDEGSAAMAVENVHAQHWKVRTDQLWEDAVRNAKKLLPAEFFTMNYALKEAFGKSGFGSAGESENLFLENQTEKDGLYVLSNRLRSYGAACIAYPHITEMIGQILRKDYYILPSSVHEVVIVPYSRELSVEEMNEMVEEINVTQLAEEEVLSGHVYLYERSSGKLGMAG